MSSLIAERSVLKTAPAAEPLTLAELKLHLRVTGSADNDYITSLGTAARRRVEEITGRALINQTWYLYADEWPSCDRFRLPKAPLSSVTSVTYYDTDGTQNTFSASSWDPDTNATPGEVVLTYGSVWPSTTMRPNSPIVIEYVAGYGASGSSVPEELKQAIYLMVGLWYAYREPIVTGSIVSTIPEIIPDLLAPYTVEWWRP